MPKILYMLERRYILAIFYSENYGYIMLSYM